MRSRIVTKERPIMAKRFYDGSYAGQDARRSQEASDSGMMPSGTGSFANMPQEVVFKAYPKVDYAMPENLNDKLSGVDGQMSLDIGKRKSHTAPKKV